MTDWHSRFKLPAWRHQLREFDEHKDDLGRMLRWQMRTGKTKAAIDKTCYWYETGRVDALVIYAPNNVHANWPRKELPKHMWAGIPWRSITWDTTKSRNISYQQEFERCLKFQGLLVLCVNVEAVSNPRFQKEFLKPFLRARKAFGFIGDETHNISRNVASKRSRAARGLAHHKKCAFRLGLSGTITDNSPLHAYGQYELLSKGALGFDSYKGFEDHFAEHEDVYTKHGPIRQISAYVNQEELQARIAEWTSVVLREECDDLPDLVLTELCFEMAEEQRRLYNNVALGGIARLDRGEIIPPKEGGALLIQLQQIASGYVIDEEGTVHDAVPPEENPRLVALRSELALCGPKTVIWCRYREDIVRVMAACKGWGYKPVDYWGGTKREDRPIHEDRFQTKDWCGPMVAQPKACSEGLDFSAGRNIIWYSHLHGDLITRKQADERCTAVGGVKIGVTNLVAMGSNDSRYIEDMELKHDTSEFLTGEGLRRYLELAR